MSYVIGIDLGTTYSAAAVADAERVDIFQLGSRAATIPSIVVLRDDGEILVGDAAERRASAEPARAAREFKRRLGDPTPLIVGGSPFGAEALMAVLLRSIVRQVSEERGEPPTLIAITHPASYGEYKLDLMRQMARQAEAGETVFLAEPVAAALHYASQERIEPGATVAVYDFGGGTFDAAVLRKSESGSFDILGQPEGLERLGGIDFDEAVFSHVAETLGRAVLEGDGGSGVRIALGRLREECRGAKESLSADTEATIPVMLPALQTEVRLTRSELEDIVRPRVRETEAALERSVRSAGLAMDDLDRILLVGGSSRMPLVGQVLREMTGRPISRDTHPKHTIALGAAVFARDHATMSPTTAAPASVEVVPPPPPVEAPEVVAAPVSAAPVAQPTNTAPPPPAPAPARPEVAAAVQPVALADNTLAAAERPLAAVTSAPRSRKRWYLGGGVAAAIVVAGAAAGALLLGGGSASASSKITDVQVNNGEYQVWFSASGFTPSEAGERVRFFWNTATAAGGGLGDWAGGSPVSVAAVSDRPAGATQLCTAVVDDSGVRSIGNCWTLPG